MDQIQIFMRRPNLDDLPPLPPLPAGHELRAARAADAAGLAAVLASAFGPEWTVDHVHRELLGAPDVRTTFVVTEHGIPVATASARLLPDRFPGSGYLHWVGVDAAHRGRRLGAVVTLAVLHEFRAIGCRDAVLETEPFRLPAVRIYLNLGFRPEPAASGHEAVWHEVLASLDPGRG